MVSVTASRAEPRALVSVIVPAFNASETIRRAIASILSQTYRALEVIVVDDASCDDTVNVVRGLTEKWPVRLIVQTSNHGPAAARNAGLLNARGEYIAFLDSDDEWRDDKIEKQVHALEANPNASLCCCDDIWFYPDGTAIPSEESKDPANAGPVAWKTLLARSFLHTSSVVARSRSVRVIGSFREELLVGEDQDYWIRLARLGEIVWVGEPLTQVYKRTTGHMSRNVGRMMEDLVPMIEGHISEFGDELTNSERRNILRQRYAQVGMNLCMMGEYRRGAGFLMRCAALGRVPAREIRTVLAMAAKRFLPVKSVTQGVIGAALRRTGNGNAP